MATLSDKPSLAEQGWHRRGFRIWENRFRNHARRGLVATVTISWRDSEEAEEIANLVAQAWTIPALRAALHGLIEVAEQAMPNSFFQSDSRVVAARAALALAQEQDNG